MNLTRPLHPLMFALMLLAASLLPSKATAFIAGNQITIMFPLMTRSALRNAAGTLTYTVQLFSTCDHYGRNKVKSADAMDLAKP